MVSSAPHALICPCRFLQASSAAAVSIVTVEGAVHGLPEQSSLDRARVMNFARSAATRRRPLGAMRQVGVETTAPDSPEPRCSRPHHSSTCSEVARRHRPRSQDRTVLSNWCTSTTAIAFGCDRMASSTSTRERVASGHAPKYSRRFTGAPHGFAREQRHRGCEPPSLHQRKGARAA